MSIRLTSRVYELQLDARLQRVLLILCDHANDDGVCWPSFDRMAWALGLNERTVRRAVDDLEKRGVVRIERHIGKSHTYHIDLSSLPAKPAFKGRNPGQNVRTTDNEVPDKMSALPKGKRGQNVRTTPDILSPTAGQNVHRTIEPSSEPINSGPSMKIVKNDDEPKPAVKGDTPVHHLVNRFYEIIGGTSPTPPKDIGHGKTLHAAGITPDDLPAMIDWARRDWCGRDGFDLATLARNATRFRTANAGKPENRLPDWVTLAPGEKVQQVGEGAWNIEHPGYGYTRKIRPEWGRVIFDSRKHQSYEGQRDFAALVRAETEARAS